MINRFYHKGEAMKKIWLIALFLIGCKSFDPMQQSKDFQPDPIIYGAEETQVRKFEMNLDVINEINTKRLERGIAKVAVDSSLVCSAENQARFIGKYRVCTHTGSGYTAFWQRAKKCGFKGNAGGEIIACGHRSAKDAVDGWFKSPGHNRIMFGNYKFVGCDMVNNYWVCVFGS